MPARSPFTPLLALLSGVLLYVFAAGWKIFAVFAAPLIFTLHEGSPRLAALGWLALATSPAIVVGVGHRVTHAVLDAFSRDAAKSAARRSPTVASAWAGLLAWFTMGFAAIASVLVLLALFPLPAASDGIGGWLALAEDLPMRLGVHAGIWVLSATSVYWLESAARGAGDA